MLFPQQELLKKAMFVAVVDKLAGVREKVGQDFQQAVRVCVAV